MATNSFGARDRLEVGDAAYEIFRLDRGDGSARLPYSLKVLLETCCATRTAPW
jgi:aconitate hydratase